VVAKLVNLEIVHRAAGNLAADRAEHRIEDLRVLDGRVRVPITISR
jgi:hypothetical protein